MLTVSTSKKISRAKAQRHKALPRLRVFLCAFARELVTRTIVQKDARVFSRTRLLVLLVSDGLIGYAAVFPDNRN